MRGRTLVRFMEALYPGHSHVEMIVPGWGTPTDRCGPRRWGCSRSSGTECGDPPGCRQL